jgi:hypothetical protein
VGYCDLLYSEGRCDETGREREERGLLGRHEGKTVG